ncbi:fimbrial biogenesis chaperone [Solitalea koreensis]|uniref:P pilus assembly protein, chaperone PapD n=1 Tax=Solitalea koreensis TaxID=543615 RepID=A0A521C385_9SPHI|nr:hypothetical protein [Solitalea koreensis]SMO53947.1 hypothetical protein SAMN06265350_103182 [Solitalea koreensis]
MKKLFALSLLLFCLTSVYAQEGFTAYPMKVNFNVAPGQSKTETIYITNTGVNPAAVNFSFADWKRDVNGSIVYFNSGTLPNSCASWIRVLADDMVTIQPGEKKAINIQLLAPANMDSTNRVSNAMLFITQVDGAKRKNEKGIGVVVKLRMGIHVYNSVPGLKKKEIEIIDFRDTIAKNNDNTVSRVLKLAIKNTGEMLTDGVIKFELTNKATGKKTKLPELNIYTLPGAYQEIKIEVPPNLVSGNYAAIATIDYGSDEDLSIGELEFDVKKK